jgi:hypothetical protein
MRAKHHGGVALSGPKHAELSIDKVKLLQQAIAQVEQSLHQLGAGYAVAKQAVLDSPHVMKSKREVTGIESSYLANALAGNIQERESWLRTLRGLRLPEAPQRAALGCVVGIGLPEEPPDHLYIILPVCGGLEISLEGGIRTVRVLTPEAPVARALIGKSLGEGVTLRKGEQQPQCIRLLL